VLLLLLLLLMLMLMMMILLRFCQGQKCGRRAGWQRSAPSGQLLDSPLDLHK
jgi:hypothetical protein